MGCLEKCQTTRKMLRTQYDHLSFEKAQVVIENGPKLQKWRFGVKILQQWSKQVQNIKSDLEKWIWEQTEVKCKIWLFKGQMTIKFDSKPWNSSNQANQTNLSVRISVIHLSKHIQNSGKTGTRICWDFGKIQNALHTQICRIFSKVVKKCNDDFRPLQPSSMIKTS